MNQFLSGAVMALFLVNALFFLRAWRKTGERLFVCFGVAFALMSLERVAFAHQHLGTESDLHVFVIRLAAYVIIAAAIVERNVRDERPPEGP